MMKTRQRRHRNAGQCSPLDTQLSEEVREELARRCKGPETFATIRQWLLAEHGLQTSITSLSLWRSRRLVPEAGDQRTVLTSGFEITVKAPGAASITVNVKPIGKGAAK